MLEQTKGTLKIIAYLKRKGKSEISAIIKSNHIPRQSCYTALRRLEDMGLISTFRERTYPPKVFCELTQRGSEVANNLFIIDSALGETLEGYKRQLSRLIKQGKSGKIMDEKKLKILRKILEECFNLGKQDDAMMYAMETRRLSQKLHDDEALADALRNMGLIHHRRQEFKAAMRCFKRSVKLAYKLKDYGGIVTDNYNLGVIFERKGNYSKALALYKQSKEHAEISNTEIEKGRANLGIGRILAQKGHYNESIKNMKKAVSIFESLKSTDDLPKAYTNLGSTEFYVNLDNAIMWHEKCIKISEKERNLRMLGYGLSNAAGCYIIKTELKKARSYLDRALPIFERLDEKVMVSSVLTKYARISLLRGRRKHAVNYINRAMKIAKDIGIPSETADVLFQYGITLKERGEYVEAKSCFVKSLKIYTELGEKKKIKEVENEIR